MKKITKLNTPYGLATITQSTTQLTTVMGETDNSVYYAQGYATAYLRLWQLELTRRIAEGCLSELFGASTIEADKFQRQLQLKYLANRDYTNEIDSTQRSILQAYSEGINAGIKTRKTLSSEFYILGTKPRLFHPVDCYLIAHLKYFINTTWKSRILQTRLAQRLPITIYQQFFSNIKPDLNYYALPQENLEWIYEQARRVTPALQLLGLESIDNGSSCFAINHNNRTFLAFDPHMGHVMPAFVTMFHLKSDEDLNVLGANMPGGPGINFGRNTHYAWGMTGIMADNQELYLAPIEATNETIEFIAIKNQTGITIPVEQSPCGHRLFKHESIGAYLYWPALDHGVGNISFYRLNRGANFTEFRSALSHYCLSPMMCVYADESGNVGSQLAGLIPRKLITGTPIVKDYTDSSTHWQGYYTQDELPHDLADSNNIIIHANQILKNGTQSETIASRWHPPTRFNRIKQLIGSLLKQSDNEIQISALHNIQLDQWDSFAPAFIERYRKYFPNNHVLLQYKGNTQETDQSQLLDRLLFDLGVKILSQWLEPTLVKELYEQWPAFRWSVDCLISQLPPIEQQQLFTEAFNSLTTGITSAHIIYRHALGEHPLLARLYNRSYAHKGGNRETIYTERMNSDFLSESQSVKRSKHGFVFGPACHLVFEFNNKGDTLYLNSSANNESILSPAYWQGFKRRQRGQSYYYAFNELGHSNPLPCQTK